MFRTSVAVVPITALVRDRQNRIVRDLGRDDFQVLEQGKARPIVDFKSKNDAEVSVAFLFDTSGSMRLALNLEKGIWFIEHFLSQMAPASDEAALFTFHKTLRQEVPFTGDPERIHQALGRVNPWGLTSLYDAVAETAKRLADRPSPRRAVVVISDGVDTSSALTAQQVSSLASSIDVPVYVIAVVNPIDHPGTDTAVGGMAQARVETSLTSLADWTGGGIAIASTPAHISVAARTIVTELRHQYLLAFEASRVPGWYPLEIRTVQKKNVRVRARSGYIAGS